MKNIVITTLFLISINSSLAANEGGTGYESAISSYCWSKANGGSTDNKAASQADADSSAYKLYLACLESTQADFDGTDR